MLFEKPTFNPYDQSEDNTTHRPALVPVSCHVRNRSRRPSKQPNEAPSKASCPKQIRDPRARSRGCSRFSHIRLCVCVCVIDLLIGFANFSSLLHTVTSSTTVIDWIQQFGPVLPVFVFVFHDHLTAYHQLPSWLYATGFYLVHYLRSAPISPCATVHTNAPRRMSCSCGNCTSPVQALNPRGCLFFLLLFFCSPQFFGIFLPLKLA